LGKKKIVVAGLLGLVTIIALLFPRTMMFTAHRGQSNSHGKAFNSGNSALNFDDDDDEVLSLPVSFSTCGGCSMTVLMGYV